MPRFSQSMPEDLHELVKNEAKKAGKSVNQYINDVISGKISFDRLSEIEQCIDDHEKRIKKLEGKK